MGNEKRIYCDFGCRRPDVTENGLRYGIFSVAFYLTPDDRKAIYKRVIKADLWNDDAYTTSIQSYGVALDTIYTAQKFIQNAGFTRVLLRTESAVLVNWIANPRAKKVYAPFLERANFPYRVGGFKELTIGVGVCERVNYERSRKYCKDEFVTEDLRVDSKEIGDNKAKAHVLVTGTRDMNGVISNNRKTVLDFIEDSVETADTSGFKMV